MKQEKYSASKSTFKFIANILSWTALALLLVIAAFLLYLAVSAKLYAAKGEKYEPKFSLYTIISPSMEPNLRVYDIIVDQRVDSVNDIKIGDVITFISTSSISANKTITHRVIDIVVDKEGNYQYKTKGDNNLSPDLAYAEYNNIIGKVIFKIPQLGRIQFFLANQGGWLIAVVIPALIIIIKDVMKIFKLAKINKKAEGIVEGTKTEDEEEKKKRQEAELNRKKQLKDKFKLMDKNDNEEIGTTEQEENDIILDPLLKEEKEELVIFNSLSPMLPIVTEEVEATAESFIEDTTEETIANTSDLMVSDNYIDEYNSEVNVDIENVSEETPAEPSAMDLELPILKTEEIKLEKQYDIEATKEETKVSDSVSSVALTNTENEVSEPLDSSVQILQSDVCKVVENIEVSEDNNGDVNIAASLKEESNVTKETDIYESIFNHFDNLTDEMQQETTIEKKGNYQSNNSKNNNKKRANNKKNNSSKKHR